MFFGKKEDKRSKEDKELEYINGCMEDIRVLMDDKYNEIIGSVDDSTFFSRGYVIKQLVYKGLSNILSEATIATLAKVNGNKSKAREMVSGLDKQADEFTARLARKSSRDVGNEDEKK